MEKIIKKVTFITACVLSLAAFIAIFSGAVWHWVTFVLSAILAVTIYLFDKPFKK